MDGINPVNPTANDFKNAEKFMARQYGSTEDTLNEVRVTSLLLCDKPEDSPPTSNAAGFHLRRSICQASKWVHASKVSHEDLPSPVESGCFQEEEGHLIPIMTTEPMPAMLQEIVTCNCQGNCNSGRCKCQKAGLRCTHLCHKTLKFNHEKCLNMNTE